MKRTIAIHLFFAAISEALILLVVHGISHSTVEFWKWQNPDGTVQSGASNGLLIAKAGLVIPAVLLLLAVAAVSGRLTSLKTTIHCLGVSLLLTSLISFNTATKSFLLFMPGVITEMGSPPLTEDAKEESGAAGTISVSCQ